MQKILDIVEDLKRGGTGGSSNSLSGLSDNSLLQVFNALNELKNQLQVSVHIVLIQRLGYEIKCSLNLGLP